MEHIDSCILLHGRGPGWTVAEPAQRSKGARSFRGQKILQPGHQDAPFSSKKVDDLFLVVAPQNTGRQRRFTIKI